jgi:hypothetical protein
MAEAKAHLEARDRGELTGLVATYSVPPGNYTLPDGNNRRYPVRPFAYMAEPPSGVPATANAILNHAGVVQPGNRTVGQVVRVVHGPVPLWGARQGEDVMMTGALAFDIRVFDPGAPLFQHTQTQVVLQPGDPGWRGYPTDPPVLGAYLHDNNMGSGAIGTNVGPNAVFPYLGQGAYVDMGYGYDKRWDAISGNNIRATLPAPKYAPAFASASPPWFFELRELPDVLRRPLSPGYAVYDTWSFHYENNGVNEDNDEVANGAWSAAGSGGTPSIDEGTNGLDDFGHYVNPTIDPVVNPPWKTMSPPAVLLGVDDNGERETAPPYDRPLRGLQVLIRVYEPDSRAIRQVRVNQHFMPE